MATRLFLQHLCLVGDKDTRFSEASKQQKFYPPPDVFQLIADMSCINKKTKDQEDEIKKLKGEIKKLHDRNAELQSKLIKMNKLCKTTLSVLLNRLKEVDELFMTEFPDEIYDKLLNELK